ncbi:uncharacterized protein LOC131424576 isoform X3 [Marmota monax]|nr:uncharacterized protein LOC131424576 isoform X3 [Marmota monax]
MGECPVWEEETGQVVFVDINARTVCQWNPLSGEVQTNGLRDPVGCVALRREGSYVVASGTCLGLLDWATGQVEWAAWLDRDKPHNRFNDGKVDPAGRFVAGELLKGLAQATWRASHHGGCRLGGDLRSPPQAAGKRPPEAMQVLGSPQVPSHSKAHGFQVILPGSLPREDPGRVEAARVGQRPGPVARGHSRAAEGPAPLPEQASSQWDISGVPPFVQHRGSLTDAA